MSSWIKQFLDCLIDSLSGGKHKASLTFVEVVVDDYIIRGNITMVKLEFGQAVEFTAEFVDRHGNPATVQEGSAEWSVTGMDADGNPVDAFRVEVNPDNAASARVFAQGDVEATGVVTLRADGDTDEDEELLLVATSDLVLDSPNAVAVSLTAGEPVDV